MSRQHATKCSQEVFGEEYECNCDGFHTFEELYDHRIALFRAVTANLPISSWRSKLHADGTMFDGYFIAGISDKPGFQISYHMPMKYWDDFDHCQTLDCAPDWDGHTSDDVLERLKRFV